MYFFSFIEGSKKVELKDRVSYTSGKICLKLSLFLHNLDSITFPWLFFRSDMVPRKRSQLPYHVSTD